MNGSKSRSDRLACFFHAMHTTLLRDEAVHMLKDRRRYDGSMGWSTVGLLDFQADQVKFGWRHL